jgi:hypothetical protein
MIRRLIPMCLIVVVVYLRITYGRAFWHENNFRMYFLIFMGVCFIVGVVFNINQVRTWVNEVQFADDKVIIVAYDFNTRLEEKFDVSKTAMELKLDPTKKRYYLEISSNERYYYINKSFNWKNSTLIDIIDDYRSRSNRTIFGIEMYPELVAQRDKNPSLVASYFG